MQSKQISIGWRWRLLPWLASPRWMLAFFLFAVASAVVSMERPDWITEAWIVPLAVFATSLGAALITNPRFRRDTALLGIHVGLLLFVLLVAFARLTYLDGAVTLRQGAAFDGKLQVDRRGPFHPANIEKLKFANEGFVEDFGLQARWRATTNRVRWWDDAETSHVAEIGDDRPLLLDGYRIYTTRNRGYAPIFHWQPIRGQEEMGAVQLRAGQFDRANDWQLPNGPEIWVQLDSEEKLEIQPGERRPNLGTHSLAHILIVRSGDRREILRPGGSLEFPEGRLTYLRLDSWMGYHVVYDVAMYWMASAAAVVAISMMLFYGRLIKSDHDAEKTGSQAV